MKPFISLINLSFLLSSSLWAADPILHLETNLAPPYQVLDGQQLSGESVQTIRCVLNKLRWDFHINLVPWKRAQNNLTHGSSDGFFSSTEQSQLDEVAEISAPIVLEKWFWYGRQATQLTQPNFPTQLKIGVLRGSSQEEWLQNQHQGIAQAVNQLPSLIKLLEIGRIDTFLIDQNMMNSAFHYPKEAAELHNLPHRFERYMPMGIYFSHHFLGNHPGFIRQFNQQILGCEVASIHLTTEEEQQLREQTNRAVSGLLQDAGLRAAVQQMNIQHRHLSDDSIHQADQVWIQVANGEQAEPEWIRKLLDSPVSKQLQAWQQHQAQRVAEVMLTDERGLLIAASRLTSNYMQGQEEKVINTLEFAAHQPADSLEGWIDRGGAKWDRGLIGFDESTGAFLVHISYPLRLRNQVIGILSIGVNVEKSLQASSLAHMQP